jgi:hypothetical protein
MKKDDLATELRSAQYELGHLPRRLIDALSANELITCYITCSCCNEKQIEDPAELDRIIDSATDMRDFLRLCNDHTHRREWAKRIAAEEWAKWQVEQ